MTAQRILLHRRDKGLILKDNDLKVTIEGAIIVILLGMEVSTFIMTRYIAYISVIVK